MAQKYKYRYRKKTGMFQYPLAFKCFKNCLSKSLIVK
jgi:hypothetical protein